MHDRKSLTLALAVAMCLALGACASAGTQTINDFGRYQQTQPGATTKAQIHGIFGQPHEVRYQERGGSEWTYFQFRRRPNAMTFIPYVGMVGGGDNYDINQADFTFNEAGLLLHSRRHDLRGRYVNMHAALIDSFTSSNQVTVVEQEMQQLGLPFDRREAERVAHWVDLTD